MEVGDCGDRDVGADLRGPDAWEGYGVEGEVREGGGEGEGQEQKGVSMGFRLGLEFLTWFIEIDLEVFLVTYQRRTTVLISIKFWIVRTQDPRTGQG